MLQPRTWTRRQGQGGCLLRTRKQATQRRAVGAQNGARPRARLWAKRGRRGRLSQVTREVGRVAPGRVRSTVQQPLSRLCPGAEPARCTRCWDLAHRQEQRGDVGSVSASAARPDTRWHRRAGGKSSGIWFYRELYFIAGLFCLYRELYFIVGLQPGRAAQPPCADYTDDKNIVAHRDPEEWSGVS